MTPGQAARVDPASTAYRVHAHAFNTLTTMLASDDRYIPLSVRDAIASAIVEAIEPIIRDDAMADVLTPVKAASGDTVVMAFNGPVSARVAHDIRERWAAHAPDVRLVIADNVADVRACKPASDGQP